MESLEIAVESSRRENGEQNVECWVLHWAFLIRFIWAFSVLRKGFGVWVEKCVCRCEERWLAQSTGVWQFGKLGRSEVDGEREPDMERSREKTSLGRVLGERLEQVFCQDLALALVITVEVYLEVAI